MSEISAAVENIKTDLKVNETALNEEVDVVQESNARASLKTEHRPKLTEGEIPPKKRKTRRGKSKKKSQYINNGLKSNKLVKPEAPHNSNQFLLEDQGGLIKELDENLKSFDQVSNSTPGRTRDSSVSIDSDGEFYSSPDDEEQFLIKDFDDQYESLHAERLQGMSKTQLIEEYIILENKLEQLSKRLQKNIDEDKESKDNVPNLKREVERLMIENDYLRKENDKLRSKVNGSDSEDSETDSSDSCSSSSSGSSGSNRSCSPMSTIDYSQTNGHSSVSPV